MDMGRPVYYALLIVDGHGSSARWIGRREPEQSRPPHNTPKARGPPRKRRENRVEVPTDGEGPYFREILCPRKNFDSLPLFSWYNHEDSQDPHCVRSRTGYVILVAGCPVLWKSKLQTEIALSTMEAEYVALSQACKDLFPLLDMVKELGTAVGLPVDEHTNMHIKVHEDNVGALTLGRLEPKRMTPRSKHYAIKYHWFREQIGPRNIIL
eukprot:scaffold37794_cov37-Cyclotella_meneghiniana.AAC.2